METRWLSVKFFDKVLMALLRWTRLILVRSLEKIVDYANSSLL